MSLFHKQATFASVLRIAYTFSAVIKCAQMATLWTGVVGGIKKTTPALTLAFSITPTLEEMSSSWEKSPGYYVYIYLSENDRRTLAHPCYFSVFLSQPINECKQTILDSLFATSCGYELLFRSQLTYKCYRLPFSEQPVLSFVLISWKLVLYLKSTLCSKKIKMSLPIIHHWSLSACIIAKEWKRSSHFVFFSVL